LWFYYGEAAQLMSRTSQSAALQNAGPPRLCPNQKPMLTLRIQFDQCPDPKAALAAVRVKKLSQTLRLQDDLLMVATSSDHSFRFGRHWNCDVFLLDADAFARRLSKEHLQIEVTSQRCFVRDLATKNGTMINGKWLGGPPGQRHAHAAGTPSGRKELRKGDVIGLPGITLTVIEASVAMSEPVRAANPQRL
jgi:pSer/pThr/pTyr-binding forkhead associated (FHA) protein